MIERLERLIAGVLVASRWLMVPLYLGLIVALIVIGIEFFRELVHTVAGIAGLDTDGVILAVLKLIDLVLIANLVLIMISAGVGTLGTIATETDHTGWIEFVGKVESRLQPRADFPALIQHERTISPALGGRTVMDDKKPPRRGEQLKLF